MKKALHGLCVITFAGAMFGAGEANAQSYTFTTLGGVGGTESSAWGINDAGQVVGGANCGSTSCAVLWNGATATNLGVGYARSINNAGQVVGLADGHPALWKDATATDLGNLGGTSGGVALAINGSGTVVGWSKMPGNNNYSPTLWNGAVATDLGSFLGGTGISATGINNAGQVVGISSTTGNVAHATFWSGATVTDLGTLGGDYSGANGINNAGQVVGFSNTTGNVATHATLWNGMTATDLGTLGGVFSEAYSINNLGQAVGITYDVNGYFRATLWNGAAIIDLNNFLDASSVSAGWVLTVARGINEQGMIVGQAVNFQTNLSSAFLLTPVPEPETYAMLLAGLGVIGAVSRRRVESKRAT